MQHNNSRYGLLKSIIIGATKHNFSFKKKNCKKTKVAHPSVKTKSLEHQM